MLNTNIRILHYPTFLIFSFLLSKGSGDSFIWQKSRSLTDPNRYFEGVLPCEDDNIIIETDDNPAILYLNDDLKVSSIYFQPNGILYFGSSAIIGDQKGDWQCKKNYAVEDAVIKDDEAPSFFDYRSWHQMDLLGRRIKHPKLHALMVPSSDDIAILQTTKPSKITIGNQVQLGRLIFNHKFEGP
ncbi:unnamed protein product [Bursaphelenchus okinawaensis]|uniref:Protein amnionless n=1 Tax=Bursaphelenchus okinawaensis TaxID=465554 RepID=A0A811LA70_9BILA|nr:unnamed protein product [Bursaphelenchus okinawaensis]CAG9121927.1 unnamed protein product [Bursaphelenchus okinawaensis]